jgi:hypothetical protein
MINHHIVKGDKKSKYKLCIPRQPKTAPNFEKMIMLLRGDQRLVSGGKYIVGIPIHIIERTRGIIEGTRWIVEDV